MSQNNNFVLYTTNWKTEPILSLADHFHFLHAVEGQQKRLSEYRMDNPADLTLFNAIVRTDKIQRIEMHLGLEGTASSTEFTSCFYMAVYHAANEPTYFKFKSFQKPPPDPNGPGHDSDFVPRIFKQMIAKNWDEIDNHLIDDLFVATNDALLERVHYFLIGETMTTFIKEMLNECSSGILGVTIYAGVDLNKFSNKKTISFTPVLGIKLAEPVIESYIATGNSNCLKGEILIEYSMPCPPACKPPPGKI